MHAPQIIMIVLITLSVSRGVIKHGESDGTVSAPANIIGAILTLALLWWGGFFGEAA